jgi:hypothetical protein
MDINPYAPSQPASVVLRSKAQALLARRNVRTGITYYLRRAGWGYAAVNLLLLAMVAMAWYVEFHPIAYATAGYWAARLIRDIQWFRLLGREWDTSQEFVDWPKVELIARGG